MNSKIAGRIFVYAFGIIAVLSTLMLAMYPDIIYAQSCDGGSGGFVPLECFKGSGRLSDVYANTEELGPFIQKVFAGAIALGAMIAVFRLAWGGFSYMASDLWSTKEHAREIIRETLFGLFLLLAIYTILYQINPDILNLQIAIKDQPSTPSNQNSNQNVQGGIGQPSQAFFSAVEGESTYTNPAEIPPGAWCYQIASNYFSCSPTASDCNNLHFQDTQGAGLNVLSNCAQH